MRFLSCLLIALLQSLHVHAATIVIPESSRGTYVRSTPYPGNDGDTGFYPATGGYDVGRMVTFNSTEWRTFFIFDLSAIPEGEVVTSVRVLVAHASGSNGPGAFDLTTTITPIAVLVTPGSNKTAEFDSLGTGTLLATGSYPFAPVYPHPLDLPGTSAFVDFLNQTTDTEVALSARAPGARASLQSFSLQVETVPEPGAATLLLSGTALLFGVRRRQL
jgi:hypothetical protein